MRERERDGVYKWVFELNKGRWIRVGGSEMKEGVERYGCGHWSSQQIFAR